MHRPHALRQLVARYQLARDADIVGRGVHPSDSSAVGGGDERRHARSQAEDNYVTQFVTEVMAQLQIQDRTFLFMSLASFAATAAWSMHEGWLQSVPDTTNTSISLSRHRVERELVRFKAANNGALPVVAHWGHKHHTSKHPMFEAGLHRMLKNVIEFTKAPIRVLSAWNAIDSKNFNDSDSFD